MIENHYDKLMFEFGDNYVFFLRGPFGQWFRRKITIDGVIYNCNEQYMMAEKAKLFNDSVTWAKIILETSPSKQKDLGREVQGFDKDVWDLNARDIVYKGNYAKFTQHLDFQEKLLATAGNLLVEANPVDSIWAIGLGEDHQDIQDRTKWQGLNWLGQVLTKVREDILLKHN